MEKTGRRLVEALKDRFNLFLNGERVKLPEDSNLQLKDKDEMESGRLKNTL